MGIKDVFLLFVLIIGCYCEGPILETKIGKIQGIQSEKTFRNKTYTINAYLGIPYAKPPVGEHRFKRPVPYGDLASPFDASKFGSSCPQIERPPFAKYSINEDCLFLNVYVPATASDRPEGHAIMIWIHGGGLNYGAGQLYAGEVLAAHGNVIIVTINYRVGVFGFLNIGDERAQGNMGLWDQRLAMNWIKENIGSFGGDINRITIFGESAGAVSVNIHIMYPPNKGLFQQAISQSGAARSKFGSAAPHVTLAAYLGCNLSTADEIFYCLNNTNAKDVVDIQLQLRTDISKYEEISFMETIDGELIKRFQHDTIQDGLNNRQSDEIEFMQSLRYINGVNGNEGLSTFLRILNAPLNEMIVTKEVLDNDYIPKFLSYIYPGQEVPPEVQKVIAYEYTNWVDPEDATRMFIKYAGDVTYNVESMDLRTLHLKGEGSRIWVYSFEANMDQHLLSTPDWATTANHGDDLAPLFGYQID
ncbi:neuroligin-4, Y-linked-like [Mya arenaria]|uniref:neuroligin-4, Y-linked-like n=1 Tax=Mya arenaria TaxID=6604 RepID=UPI0022E48AF2|nr:neuroligin-4, Y-linked-like [Mya arenaria]